MTQETVTSRVHSAGSDRFTLLIDGKCPLCAREVAWMKRRDKSNKLRFVDIAADGFDPSLYDKSQAELMGTIHGVTQDGDTVTGVEVFRRAYTAIGLGWLIAPTRLPVIKQSSNVVYAAFAKIRPRLQRQRDCDTGTCKTW